MARRNRECYLCGEKYNYCHTCSDDKNKPAWMSMFHSENCVKIFQICTNFNMDIMTKYDAKEVLNECDLSNKENFKSFVQRDLENIFAEDKAPEQVVEPKKRNKKAEMPIMADIETVEVHEVVEE